MELKPNETPDNTGLPKILPGIGYPFPHTYQVEGIRKHNPWYEKKSPGIFSGTFSGIVDSDYSTLTRTTWEPISVCRLIIYIPLARCDMSSTCRLVPEWALSCSLITTRPARSNTSMT